MFTACLITAASLALLAPMSSITGQNAGQDTIQNTVPSGSASSPQNSPQSPPPDAIPGATKDAAQGPAAGVEQDEAVESFQQDWPALRARYLALYWNDTHAAEDEELKKIGERLDAVVGKDFHVPEWLADDPAALAVLSARAFRRVHEDRSLFNTAEQLARRAIELGNPRGIGSYRLAVVLVHRVQPVRAGQILEREDQEQLDEAEQQAVTTSQLDPQAHTKPLLGRIAILRGKRGDGYAMLRAAMEERPRSKLAAWEYVSTILQDPDRRSPFAEEIDRVRARFPDDAHFQTLLGLGLFRDRRFDEAAKIVETNRTEALESLGAQLVDTITSFKDLPAEFAEGVRAIDEDRPNDAEMNFRAAVAKRPDRVEPARMLARVLWKKVSDRPGGIDMNGAATIRFDIAELAEKFPDDAEIVSLYVVILAFQQQFLRAEGLLNQLDQKKIDYRKYLQPEVVAGIRESAAQVRDQRMRHFRQWEWPDLKGWDRRVLIGLGVWFGWIAFMAVAGVLLTRLSRPRLEEILPSIVGPTRREAGLNWLYLLLLTIALLMYYVAVPFVVLGLMLVSVGLFFGLFLARLMVVDILIRGFYAAWGVLRSAFAGSADAPCGLQVNALQQPELFRVLQEAADRCEVRAPERVFLTPDTSIGVSESRAGLFGLLGHRTRTLSLGLAALPSIRVEELKAILAHEFAHFSHQDTYYGRFLFQVTRSLALSLAHMSAAAGLFNYFNPFYWVFWLYLRAYGLLAAGFMRTREYQADRMAARLYGRSVFSAALTRVVVETPLFERVIPPQIVYGVSQGQVSANVYEDYRTMRSTPEMTEFQAKSFQREVDEQAGLFDLHPSLTDRLTAIASFPDSTNSVDETPAAELIAGRPEIEVTLTKLYTRQLALAAFGVVLADA